MALTHATLRKHLSAGGLCDIVRDQFRTVVDTRRQAIIDHTLSDTLICATGQDAR
jgi:hypothetical protein